MVYDKLRSQFKKIFMKKIIVLIVIIIAIFGAYKYMKPEASPDLIDNTPDENVSELKAKIDQAISAFGISLKPSEIVEDSRCPTDVQCIQAGRLRVKVEMGSSLGATSRIFEIGQSEVYDGHKITLKNASPSSKESTVELKPSDYSFTFLIEPLQ